MIKRLALVLMLILSINFLAVAGGVGYLFGTGKIDSDKLVEIGKIVFPPPPEPATQPVVDTRDPATTQPLLRLDELLNKTTGKTAAEQVAFISDLVAAQSASLERQRAELLALQRQVNLAQEQIGKERNELTARQQLLNARETQRQKIDSDEGFKKALAVYDTMDTKQIKEIFLSLDEATVVRYLQAMEPRRVSRIVKEFTTPAELAKAQSLLEMMRKNDVLPEAIGTSQPQSATP
jgi:hypothetical protein